MFCGNCGYENDGGSRFCSNCGASLEPAVNAEPVQEEIPAAAAPQQTAPQQTAPQQAEPSYYSAPQYTYTAPEQPVYTAPQQPYYTAPQQPVYNAQAEQPAPSTGMSVASLVLGILGVLGNVTCNCMCGCIVGLPSVIMSVVGLILGINAVKRANAAGRPHGMATAGVALSIVGLCLYVLVIIINFIIGGTAAFANPEFPDFYEYYYY